MSPRTALIAVLAILLFQAAPIWGRFAGDNPTAEALLAVDSGSLAVDEGDFQRRQLAWSYFQALGERQDVMIIDVRSGLIPAGDPPGLNNVRPISLEIFRQNFVARKVHQDKTLLILDASGQELQGLQYHLIKNGYHDFYFLEGGAQAAH
jgi:rhodanese-related sulfurtransferase